MLKILQARLQLYVNLKLPDAEAGFRKGRGTRVQIANLCWIIEKEFQKNTYFHLIDYTKAFDCVDQTIFGKLFKRWENTRPPDLAPEKTCMQVKKQQLEMHMEQQTGSTMGKEYIKAVCCHPAYLAYMQSTSCKMPGWMKHKLESRLLGEISITSDMQMTPPLW